MPGKTPERESDVEVRYRDHFVQRLNGNIISEVRGDVRRGRIGENEREVRKVLREEILDALKKMEGGKADGMDGIVVEMLKWWYGRGNGS